MIKNADLNAKLTEYINSRETQKDREEGNAWESLKRGDYETACSIFAQNGDWKNCLDKSQ